MKKNNRVIFISSTGGHLSELMVLKPIFKDYDYHIVTEKTGSTKSLKKEYGKRIHYVILGIRTKKVEYVFKVILNTIKLLGLYIKIRPKVIVTTGAHTAMPLCIIGKLFGAKLVFIETYANVYTPTGTGKFLYKYADKFIIQWEELREVYPNGIHLGGAF
ncbi:MAG: polysaccharide biosynthesis protein [Clostridia bacterium]|nr:polysaccharide biosynthesis protein [Clostridia bacterium]